jgi:hypothetical protein
METEMATEHAMMSRVCSKLDAWPMISVRNKKINKDCAEPERSVISTGTKGLTMDATKLLVSVLCKL